MHIHQRTIQFYGTVKEAMGLYSVDRAYSSLPFIDIPFLIKFSSWYKHVLVVSSCYKKMNDI